MRTCTMQLYGKQSSFMLLVLANPYTKTVCFHAHTHFEVIWKLFVCSLHSARSLPSKQLFEHRVVLETHRLDQALGDLQRHIVLHKLAPEDTVSKQTLDNLQAFRTEHVSQMHTSFRPRDIRQVLVLSFDVAVPQRHKQTRSTLQSQKSGLL